MDEIFKTSIKEGLCHFNRPCATYNMCNQKWVNLHLYKAPLLLHYHMAYVYVAFQKKNINFKKSNSKTDINKLPCCQFITPLLPDSTSKILHSAKSGTFIYHKLSMVNTSISYESKNFMNRWALLLIVQNFCWSSIIS